MHGDNHFTSCRSDQTWGHGWVITGQNGHFVNCESANLHQDRATLNLYDGFHSTTSSGYNTFIGCWAWLGNTSNTFRHGFHDDNWNGAGSENRYADCTSRGHTGSRFNFGNPGTPNNHAGIQDGNFAIGGGGWNTGHIVMGTYRLWIDSAGKLRVKASAPTGDLDGVVVGTQT